MARDILTDKTIKAALKLAAETGKPTSLNDGDGLHLIARPDDTGWWRFRYWIGGKENRLSLGTYPEVPLKVARERKDDARAQVAAGIDPSETRKAQKADIKLRRKAKELADAGLPALGSFEQVAREWLGTVHKAKVSEGHADRTRIRLEQDVFPWIGTLAMSAINAPMLLEVLRRVEARGAIETAHRVKQACGQVFRYGIATGQCERDPSADLKDALQPVVVKHHAAITDPKQVGAMLRAFDNYQGLPTTRVALRLAPLVFLRPGELRQAEWAEFDLDAALWTIPASRMKRSKQQKISGAPHVVPLATQAVAALRELLPLTGARRHVFPSPRGGDRPMSENAVLSALRRMGFAKDEMTGHGFRAMARTMLAERLGINESVIEAQLAHAVKDSLGRAYNRTEFIAQRHTMMQTWADYLDTLKQEHSPPTQQNPAA